jgi:hypothetical protein
MTSRDRKLKWIETFGRSSLRDAVTAILAKEGPDFLTDEQIDLITEKMVYDAREQTRRKIRNRNFYRAEAGLPPLGRTGIFPPDQTAFVRGALVSKAEEVTK